MEREQRSSSRSEGSTALIDPSEKEIPFLHPNRESFDRSQRENCHPNCDSTTNPNVDTYNQPLLGQSDQAKPFLHSEMDSTQVKNCFHTSYKDLHKDKARIHPKIADRNFHPDKANLHTSCESTYVELCYKPSSNKPHPTHCVDIIFSVHHKRQSSPHHGCVDPDSTSSVASTEGGRGPPSVDFADSISISTDFNSTSTICSTKTEKSTKSGASVSYFVRNGSISTSVLRKWKRYLKTVSVHFFWPILSQFWLVFVTRPI